ncbi:MAG: ABC transporter permease, partial [Mariprofundaceae bacterium]|nr:ABC transporter permease [Mariprofundaceae bacterium]
MDLSHVLSIAFLIALLTSGIRLAIPVFLAALGEIITERGGVLNLGLEGVMLAGALAGFMGAFYVENLPNGDSLLGLAPWVGIAAGILAGMAMGLIMAVLAITLRTDQVIASVTLVILGQGVTTYIYRQQFEELTARIQGFEEIAIPGLSRIPFFGEVLFNHDIMTYISILIMFAGWYFLFHTTWGLNIRAVGEHPAAADASGVSVNGVRYAAVLIGSALTGLGGAVLTVAQLHIFDEGITAGRGWIAVALVIFARWRPVLALGGALLFGIANALQFRIQALNIEGVPY